jgi:hypothetical protein
VEEDRITKQIAQVAQIILSWVQMDRFQSAWIHVDLSANNATALVPGEVARSSGKIYQLVQVLEQDMKCVSSTAYDPLDEPGNAARTLVTQGVLHGCACQRAKKVVSQAKRKRTRPTSVAGNDSLTSYLQPTSPF